MSILKKVLSAMEIYFSVNNGKSILKIPYVPPEISFNSPLDFETFEKHSGEYLMLTGEQGQRSLTIESFFPMISYSWLSSVTLAPACLDFFNSNRKETFRIVVVSTSINLNMLCKITNFTYKKQQNGNIKYTLEILEYKDPKGSGYV